jgi:predicted dehydrogenase
MAKRVIRFGIIGCGLMGREFASAVGRWRHLLNLDFKPEIVAVCDVSQPALDWFRENVPELTLATTNYLELLDQSSVEAVYCAVPHNQHAEIYSQIIRSGKHLLGEKPFGVDLQANQVILNEANHYPELLARCSSQFPFFPGAHQIFEWIGQQKFGKIIEVEAGFWHSSDLDPNKPINWKRMIAINGEYGCMGDLGMHVLHIPLRVGWIPSRITAFLSKIVKERPDKQGNQVACETWDNATLGCEVAIADGNQGIQQFPMFLSYKRIAPGHSNTWFIKIYGTGLSVEFSTQYPKHLRYLPYTPGGAQEWRIMEVPYRSAYPTITGSIFEFGFSDSLLQMWAAFCDELVHGREQMLQPLFCATVEETALSHQILTATLQSHRSHSTVDFNTETKVY